MKILIADDHAILRAGLRHLLADTPEIVVGGEAADGHEVIAKVQAEHWDALLLDMTMPGKSGIELIKQLKQMVPRLPILVLSMHKEDVYAVRALKAGASGYLCKDNAEEQLVAALHKVTSGGLYINAAVAEKLAADMLCGVSGDDMPLHTRLSDREYQIFQCIVAGQSVTDIASDLNLSIKTVSTHKSHLMEKMKCESVASLVRYALKHGLLSGAEG